MRLHQIPARPLLPPEMVWLTYVGTYDDHPRRERDAFFAEVVRWCHEQFGYSDSYRNAGCRWTLDYMDKIGFSDPADATATLLRWG